MTQMTQIAARAYGGPHFVRWARGFRLRVERFGGPPNSRVPAHIHFEVSAPGRSPRIFEIVFEGDPFITDRMRSDPGFSIRPIVAPPGTSVSSVAERIVLK